jgi:hypothetical protein
MLGVLMAVVATLVANPFEGRRLYVDPHSPAAQQAVAWRETRPQDAAEMDEIAKAPQAQWFGDWNADVAQAVDAHVTAAATAAAAPRSTGPGSASSRVASATARRP